MPTAEGRRPQGRRCRSWTGPYTPWTGSPPSLPSSVRTASRNRNTLSTFVRPAPPGLRRHGVCQAGARRGPFRAGPAARRAEVTVLSPVPRVFVPAVGVRAAQGCVRLFSRPHIDLQRVAGALCCP
ncbi:putative leader peptide [Streptomyces sp. NPDC003016]